MALVKNEALDSSTFCISVVHMGIRSFMADSVYNAMSMNFKKKEFASFLGKKCVELHYNIASYMQSASCTRRPGFLKLQSEPFLGPCSLNRNPHILTICICPHYALEFTEDCSTLRNRYLFSFLMEITVPQSV